MRPVAVLEPVRENKTPQQIVFEVSSMEALAKETESVINKLEEMPESEFKDLIKKYPDLLK